MVGNFLWLGPAVMMLNVGLVVSYGLWAARRWNAATTQVLRPAMAATTVQALHLVEEAGAGFQQEMPALFGQEPWSTGSFVAFNLLWLGIFAGATAAASRRGTLAYLPLTFLALVGGVGNGIVHTGLALRNGGYFPGAVTASLALVTGVFLLRALYGPPRSRRPPENA